MGLCNYVEQVVIWLYFVLDLGLSLAVEWKTGIFL